jgi:cytochrome c oxidase subunit IV
MAHLADQANKHQQHHVPPVAHYVGVFLALMVLTVATVAVASLDLGALNTVVAMLVAGTKAFLVMYIFMELRHASPVTKMAALSGIVFLAIMLIMIGQDYAARHYLPYPSNWGKTLPNSPDAPAAPVAAPAGHTPAAAPHH